MKKVIIYTLLVSGLFSVLTSCENWFDVSPKVEIKEDDLFKNEDGYFDALVGVYSLMASENLYGKNMTNGVYGCVGTELLCYKCRSSILLCGEI